MITRENFKNCILSLGYKESKNTFIKKYKNFDYEMSVNFDNEVLNYGDKVVVNDKTTSNFSHDENFVVFECVNRLIDMGYKPEDIELEPRWTLGHEAKGGKADIVVYDGKNNKSKKNVLFIIECKTYDKEYDKEYKNTIVDGGQVFSYLQQEKSTKWLSIYASNYENGSVIYKTDTIKVFDDNNILKLAEKDETILLYKNANNKEELFEVWDETYEKRFVGDVIFNEDSVAYEIGIRPLKKRDLKDFTENDNVVNKFEEILRHNNVSDKENAFNRLIALFIAKTCDEIEKDDNDIVDFQYKVGTDTFETLQDRLQRLHKDGMEKFMNEEILYIDDNYAEDLVKQYTGQKRVNMINSLKDTIRKLKFYTNNDFAFKDVHNEELFLQNGKVLLEVVELFENYRIINVSQANVQFLGDMFEQLLNQGFKQNEGQFFTPNQITRFIWESLPLKKIMLSGERIHYPKVIDYACGAGHFITQGVLCIKNFLTQEDVNYKELHPDKYFYGIEKDYRLARVSRVSLYMNSCDEGNIIFGDGLDNYKDQGIDNKKFDILVANPPYSVKEFKSHLKLYNNKLELLDGNYITNQGSEIETCFVERISQLLKTNGIAAVILPSSLLNKDGQSFNKARESILFNFKIKAVVEMGSKTFGATGTNTVIMFLEKYNEPPKRISLLNDSIEQIFEGQFNEGFEDIKIFEEYTRVINVDKSIYKNFINKKITIDELQNKSSAFKYFSNIYDELINTSEYKTKVSSKQYMNLPEKEKAKITTDLYYKYALEIEKNKMIYLALTYDSETLIISSPTENDAQEKFLGYKWSNRKGQEGIQITKYGGELYWDREKNPNDYDKTFASDLIRGVFYGNNIDSDLLKDKYYIIKTVDMLNFDRSVFNNSITLNKEVKKVWDVETKKINELYNLQEGKTPDRNNSNYWDNGTNKWLSIADMSFLDKFTGNTKELITDAAVKDTRIKLVPQNTVVMSFKLTIGKVQITKEPIYTNEAIMAFLPKNELLSNDFLRLCLMYANWGNTMKAVKGSTLNLTSIGNYELPLYDKDKQKEIVSAFDVIDEKIKRNNSLFTDIEKTIKNEFVSKFGILDSNFNDYRVEKIGKLFDLNAGGTPSTKIKEYWENGTISWIGSNMCKDEIIYKNDGNCITEKGLNNSSARMLPIDTVIVALVGATIGKVGLLKFETTTNQNVLAITKIKDAGFEPYFVFYYMQSVYNLFQTIGSGKFKMANKSFISNIDIICPPLKDQQVFANFVEEKEKERKRIQFEKDELLKQKQELINKYFK